MPEWVDSCPPGAPHSRGTTTDFSSQPQNSRGRWWAWEVSPRAPAVSGHGHAQGQQGAGKDASGMRWEQKPQGATRQWPRRSLQRQSVVTAAEGTEPPGTWSMCPCPWKEDED